MIETRITSATKEVIISYEKPTVLIGERINPTGRNKLTAELQAGDLSIVRRDALRQVKYGADVLDVNVGASGVDEVELLPEAVKVVAEAVEVPLCIDSDNPKALEAALKVYKGKPIINSVTGQESVLSEILPLVKEYGTAVIALTMDDEGTPNDVDRRTAIANKIIERAEAIGIPREDVIVDCLVMTVATDTFAAVTTFNTIRRVREELGVNQSLGASNVSFGLPEREVLNNSFLTLAINAGVNCPVVNVAKVRPAILATEVLMGRDKYALRYIRAYRQLH
jgi:5-methyltetrahydrofolate--homocysteine methyltransferase